MSDLFAGTVAGLSQVVVGHPFDTIKVLIQNNQFSNIRSLTLRNLYRGSKYPAISSVIFNATVFPIYERSFKYTKSDALSGALSGLVVSPLQYAFDVGKIKRQTNQNVSMRDMYRTKGLGITAFRETLAMSIYFGVYHYCVNEYNLSSFVSGGVSGLANWTITYPADVLRTRQMAQNCTLYESFMMPGSLWKGYSVCAFRAVLVNASVFWVYDKVTLGLD